MDLAYRHDVRTIWIANVGDIKPMEYPLAFFLAQAWNPEAMTPEALAAYPRAWATATFGPEQAGAIRSADTASSWVHMDRARATGQHVQHWCGLR